MLKTVGPLILLSVSITALAQIALKAGMSSAPVQRALTDGMRVSTLFEIAFSPFVMAGLFLYVLSVAVWLIVLSKVEVSFAYPFVALGFVMTSLAGRLVFHETFSATKIAGTLLIIVGVVVLARG